ncbi:hypothetical protein MSAR_45210 [Mycolicibacterium sarraceniae]|uniref:Uncharacterized protein n=1 Tax=Mycolicibacterium sarraceniae TaxID=1534348 RepID=A0A7I7SZH5_9MYCO|nr:hypothetical protein [Mycolicibacterium sarraceniae]BBY61385.1 hypothetical protein MSAR_45210 [Mycolicibacterium sarraceniae]
MSQVGDQAVNIARTALLGRGFPETVPGTTVDTLAGLKPAFYTQAYAARLQAMCEGGCGHLEPHWPRL